MGLIWDRRMAYTSALMALFMGLNIGLNYFNKFVLGTAPGQLGLSVPIFYTVCHTVMGFLLWSATFFFIPSLWTLRWDEVRERWIWIVALSLCFSSSTATMNASLVDIDLTGASVISSLGPLFTITSAYFIEGQRFGWAIWVSMAIQVTGAGIAVSDDLFKASDPNGPSVSEEKKHLVWFGYFLSTFSMLVKSFRPVLAAKLLAGREKGSGFTPLVMAWMDALGAIIVLLPASLVIEGAAISHHISAHGTELQLALIAGSSMAAVYNLNVFALVAATDSVSYTVVASVAKVVLIGGATLLIDHISSATMLVGTFVFLVGFVMFVVVKVTELQQRTPPSSKDAEAKEAPPSESTPLTVSTGK